MITEDYVSFETAKLLKEKGFDVWGNGSYDSGIEIYKEYSPSGLLNSCTTSKPHPKGYPAPTLQMAMKWLREAHHLFIGCEPRLSFTDFYWITANIYRVRKKSSLYHTEDVDDYHCVACCDSYSYEEACEEAIKYCLENLLKNSEND